MSREYNELTKSLLAQGYTVQNHPDNVKVGGGSWNKDNPLDNIYGGFVYKRQWIEEKTFKTPCGLMCKGKSCITGLGFSGIDWSYENDKATIRCPYHKNDCKQKHELLQEKDGILKDWCNVHLVSEEYEYAGSVEELKKLEDERIEKEKINFSLQRNGRTCSEHMHYDSEKREWYMNWNPIHCARIKCDGNFGTKVEGEKCACPILGRPLDRKKGNVYYDVKITARRYDLDGTLMEGQIDTWIKKGIRFFDHPVSMDICKNVVKLQKDEIEYYVKLNKYHQELFFAKYYGREFTVEILNIRAEQRVSRDLMQDLEDIKAGIKISYDSDLQKSDAESKRERREAAKQKKINKLESKILKIGYMNMKQDEKRQACKVLGNERIDELEITRQENIRQEQNKPKQLSLFEMAN